MANLHDYRLVRLDDLKEHPENPRVHPQSAIDKLQRSIESFGFTQPIIVSKDGYILAGHARKKAAMQAGLKEAPALFLDLEGDMADLYLIADNKLQEETDWDFPQLKDLFERLDTGLLDLELSGYTSDEIEDLMLQFHVGEEPHEDDFNVDETIEGMEELRCSLGEVWQLGNHRLMVGDSTNEDNIFKLMNEKEADMIFTDPPYNVDYEGSDGKKIQNDSMEDSMFYQFLLDAFSAMEKVTKPGGPIYVCHAALEGKNFISAFKDSGLLLKQILVWVKNALVLGRQDYQWKHEPILYGWKSGAAHKWYGGRKETTVWEVDKPKRNSDHPTMKPIPLIAQALENSSKPGDIVLDPFGGSGSTLICAEQLNRICYMMEYDEKFATVIVERWEKFTGQKAIKISG
ncbi:MAG: site-specific DNA-methyltransferase [Bacillus sp. (in: firmicutes)]